MSYKVIKGVLQKPYDEKQRIDFIVEYNHQQGYIIEEDNDNVIAYAIEPTEEEKQQAERERLNNLSMTRGDVFEALILSKGITKAQIRTMIENESTLDTITKALYLNRFDEALEFYRGYPIFDLLGNSLGITSDMLDNFFEAKDYHYLSTYTLEIQPSPSEAVITINGEITNKVTLPYNTEVEYIVSLDNYVTETGKLNLTENKVIEIELQSETSITQE